MKKTAIRLAAFLLAMTTVLTPAAASAGEAAQGYYHVSALKAANVKTVDELTDAGRHSVSYTDFSRTDDVPTDIRHLTFFRKEKAGLFSAYSPFFCSLTTVQSFKNDAGDIMRVEK